MSALPLVVVPAVIALAIAAARRSWVFPDDEDPAGRERDRWPG